LVPIAGPVFAEVLATVFPENNIVASMFGILPEINDIY
jgi:hypothetical protein